MRMALFFAAVLALLCGCRNPEYSIVLMGDLHYDKAEFHDLEVMKFKPHMDYIEGTKNKDGNFSLRNHTLWTTASKNISHKNIKLNEKMWEKDVPQILDDAAAAARQNNSYFAVQLGDMIHGDCGRLDLHKKNLQGVINELDRRFDQKVFLVCGNHDTRGPYGQEAWDAVVMPYLKGLTGNFSEKGTNYFVRIGKDLFYFHDLMNPDVDFMEQVFIANADARYTFFFTHVVVLPMDRGSFNDILSDDFHRVFALLESRNAIVLCAHTHRIALTEYRNPENGRQITQFVLNSTVRQPEIQQNFKPDTAAERKTFQPEAFYKELWKKYFDGRLKTLIHSNGAGYALLRISGSGVFVEYHNWQQNEPHIFRLR